MRFLCLVAFIICAFPVFADQEAVAAGRKTFNIGVLYWSGSIPGQLAMRRGLEQEAQLINLKADRPAVKLTSMTAGDDQIGIERQIAQMEKLIEQKVDLIIVQPTDNAALSIPLKKANEAAIPVVAFDQYINGGTLVSYITSDNYQAGYLGGEYLSSLFPNEKKLAIVLVEYPHVSSTIERVDGFLDALRDCNREYKICGHYQAVEPERGKLAGQQILKDFSQPGSVDVVFTVNDGGGLAVFRELAAAGRNEIAGITIDGDSDSVAIIRDGGIIKNDSAQFCGTIGVVALRTAYAYLNGETVPYHILVPAFPVNRETENVYKGWLAPIPGKFEKKWPSKDPVWEPQLKYQWKK